MASTQLPVFTVGHSNHSPDRFMRLLVQHGIEGVVDVRSSPYSRYARQFNKEALEQALSCLPSGPIDYVYLGAELGGRPSDISCYDADGRVSYERLADTDYFDIGLRRIMHGADERRTALMCTEKEPLACHRALLIAKALVERGVEVEHMHADGSLENHHATMDRLINIFKLPHNGDLFRSRDEVIADAVARQSRKMAYVAEERAPYHGIRQTAY